MECPAVQGTRRECGMTNRIRVARTAGLDDNIITKIILGDTTKNNITRVNMMTREWKRNLTET